MNPVSEKKKNKKYKWIFYFLSIYSILCGNLTHAQTIKIVGKNIIDRPTIYKNVNLDLSNGYFSIQNDGSLELENTVINGNISPSHQVWINVLKGELILKNNIFNVTAKDILPQPTQPTIYNVIRVTEGKIKIVANSFNVDKPYRVGLFVTGKKQTENIRIIGNNVYNFHGGFFLSNSSNALVSNNQFSNVSVTNIFTKNGNNNIFKNNVILFSGNNNVGNSIDVIESDNITISQNFISSGSCYSIVVLTSKNVLIDGNSINGCITYAIYVTPSIGVTGDTCNQCLAMLMKNFPLSHTNLKNKNIIISNNYLAQNRFGLAISDVDGLIIKNNWFIQRFSNDSNRKFWTNTAIFILNSKNLLWENNLYKEAYSQNIRDRNSDLKFVPFPSQGGVSL